VNNPLSDEQGFRLLGLYLHCVSVVWVESMSVISSRLGSVGLGWVEEIGPIYKSGIHSTA